ncbi:DUF4062 domain-containing protein [Polaribacter vadi]|uniref:DUF4062 domain-containing protein n=1 Tax=Polaribacter vadi TaxID=1774273 RepID=UPI0030ED8FC6|tara:strand:- start:54 stop:1028 length:975 start_codon:yes stop_codon:yes gene_type:complete
MKKKLQIFVSSTFTDLILERQSAVEAILRAGNIPAGMELFSAGNKSQLDTIKRWIDESDIYVIILGGRYGSLEPESGLSYTEIEYNYAVEIGKPFFALVLDDKFIEDKVKSEGQKVLELDNQKKYKDFRKSVMSKICRICTNESDIKLAILESIIDIQNEYDLFGWIKGDEIPDNSVILNELEILRKERDELQQKVISLETLTKRKSQNDNIGDYSYDEIYEVLNSKKLILPASLNSKEEDSKYTLLELFLAYQSSLTNGVTSYMASESYRYVTRNIVPTLLNFGLVQREKAKSPTSRTEYDKFFISALGNKFLSRYQIKKLKK